MAEIRETDQVEFGGPEAPPYDPVLGLYIDMVEFSESLDQRVAVTLCMGGMLVSGEVISAEAYHEATGMKEVLDRLRPDEQLERVWLQVRRFIHLKNARFFMGAHAGIPNNQGVFWRGRLSEVSGFNMGALESSSG